MNQVAPIVSFTDLSKTFKTADSKIIVLDKVSGQIQKNKIVGIQGPSGAGKSTLLHIIGGVDSPDSGFVFIDQEPIPFGNSSKCDQIRRNKIGFIFQYFHLLENLSALENVMFVLTLSDRHSIMTKAQIEELSYQALDHVGIKNRAHHYPNQLSGGEQQRVAIARATVHNPILVIADEPTGNLDHKSRDLVLNLIKNISSNGTSVLMASHSQVALATCDQVFILEDGILKLK